MEVVYGYVYSNLEASYLSENTIDIYTMGFPSTKLEQEQKLSDYFKGDQETISIKETPIEEDTN